MKGGNGSDEDKFEVDPFDPVTKMPPMHQNFNQANPPAHPAHKNYQPLNWDAYFQQLFYLSDGTSCYRAGNEGVIFFCVHGAGHSAQSFATMAKEVKKYSTVISYDLKGHGLSKKQHNNEDFSIETLCSEAIEALKEVMQRYSEKNVVIVGHSLGGSIACRITDTLTKVEKEPRVVGCIIIDVVEGTAIEALPFMNQIIADRPKSFDSLQSAVKWGYTSNTLRKLESARVSMPPQLQGYEKNGNKRWSWKVNLKETQKFWMGWFKGLSSIFLGIQVPKILITAEKQRMDKELTIAQMQGRFKVVVIHNVGHSVQEDDPKSTAHQFYHFLKDFRIPLTVAERAHKEEVGIANFHPNLAKY